MTEYLETHELKKAVTECLNADRYDFHPYALKKMATRNLNRNSAVRALKRGAPFEKDHQCDPKKGWSYALVSKLDGNEFKTVVSFAEDEEGHQMMIINFYQTGV